MPKSKVYLTIPNAPNVAKSTTIPRDPSEGITILISVPEPIKPEQSVSTGTEGGAFYDGKKQETTKTKFPQTSEIRHTLNLPSTGRERQIIPRLSLVPKRRAIPNANNQMRSTIQDYFGYMEK